jgi:hypothetical protein
MNPLIYKLSVRNGLIIAGISTVISIVLYLINPLLVYTNYVLIGLMFVIAIALLVILGLDVRRNIGGYWNFGQAFLSLMIIAVISVFIGILLNFILFKFVDPALPSKVNEALQDKITQTLQNAGLDQDKIDQSTKQFTDGSSLANLQPTFINELKSFGGAIVLYAILNLIIAACIKKNPPMFASVSDQEVIV